MGSNIVSQSFPPRYIPSFSFYYNGKISKITFEDFKDVASKAMSRRNVDFSSIEAALFDLYKKDWHNTKLIISSTYVSQRNK